MADYPVMLQLKGRRCVIIGAGPVGQRKMQSLLSTGAKVVLIAPPKRTRSACRQRSRPSAVFSARRIWIMQRWYLLRPIHPWSINKSLMQHANG